MKTMICALARAAALAVTLAAAGCAAPPPTPSDLLLVSTSHDVPPPADGMAEIVFIAPSEMSTAWIVALFDISMADTTLMGMMGSQTKSVQMVTPGHHQFMATLGGRAGAYMDADVEAGRRYYVHVRSLNANLGSFQLRAIRSTGASMFTTGNDRFPSWLESTRIAREGPGAREWVRHYKSAMEAARTAGAAAWHARTAEQQAALSLHKTDAVAL